MRIGGPNFSDILVKELHGNLPGDYHKPRPLPPKLLRTSVNARAKEGHMYWYMEKPPPKIRGNPLHVTSYQEARLTVNGECTLVNIERAKLQDLKTNLYLVQDGVVAPILKTPILSSMIPPIDHKIKDLKFRFNGTGKVQYSLNFQSSNETIMRHPMTNIRLTGLVPRKTKDKQDRINRGRNSSEQGGSTLPPPQICNKRCNKRHVMRRFCLSDFVIKARMESEISKNGLPRLRVRIMRLYKQGRVKINSKHQLLDKRGQEITCSCNSLKVNKVYLLLGKEDKRRRLLYLDNFSTALEWSKNGKQYVRANRKNNSCPQRRTP
ncbi:Netrin-5 [Stylophora pistillata]|uniref:Netrin-5 n=1 Tax=Stylophora pistillata TaxID=50429 RepID=A0A2B4S0D4_STYPI|nr:Netrin-5 [Stylophora pistillata]